MNAIVGDRITVSTVLIAGHAGPDTMIWMADHGKGRFYNVTSPNDLPQIFIKEAAVILKSAIYEDPFKPQLKALERSGARHRRGRISDAARLRGHHAQAARGNSAGDGQGRSAAGALAIWPGPRGGLHFRCQGQVEQELAGLGQIPAILVADRAMEFAAAGECGFHHGSFRGQRRGANHHGRAG